MVPRRIRRSDENLEKKAAASDDPADKAMANYRRTLQKLRIQRGYIMVCKGILHCQSVL